MNEELRQRVNSIFDVIEGGVCDDMMNMLDVAIDEGIIKQEEHDAHEQEICAIFDNGWFTCNACGWTLPISEMADNDNWECESCDN